MTRVGVHVTTTSQAGRSNTGVPSGRFFVTGLTERGPVNQPTVIRSIAHFDSVFGSRTAFNSGFYDALRSFWEEGGSEAVITRVTGEAATSGSLVLSDATPASLINLEATSPGAWSQNVTATITDVPASDYAPARSKLVLSGPAGDESFIQATAGEMVTAVNSRSVYVVARLTGTASGTLAPLAATPLTAGDDQRATVTGATLVAALDLAGTDWGSGSVAIPGYPADVVGEGLLNHAQAHNRVALLAAEEAATEADVTGVAAQLSVMNFAEYGALVYPHVVVPDGNARRVAPPEGYAAAKRAMAHQRIGAWRTPAGDFSTAQWILDTNLPVGTSLNERLVDANVTGIINTNRKIRLYGWWSLSADAENFEMLTARDVLNTLAVQCAAALEPFVFEEIDGRGILTSKVESALVGVLDPIALANGFFPMRDSEGTEVDPGYRVVVDDTLNTPESMSANRIVARVSVRLAPTANLIELEIVKVPFTGSL